MTDPSKQPVLVHCSSGAQRTSAAAMLYRHIVEGKSFDDAYPESLRYGHDPDENIRLMPYLADWADKIALAFHAGAMIPNQPRVEIASRKADAAQPAKSTAAAPASPGAGGN